MFVMETVHSTTFSIAILLSLFINFISTKCYRYHKMPKTLLLYVPMSFVYFLYVCKPIFNSFHEMKIIISWQRPCFGMIMLGISFIYVLFKISESQGIHIDIKVVVWRPFKITNTVLLFNFHYLNKKRKLFCTLSTLTI